MLKNNNRYDCRLYKYCTPEVVDCLTYSTEGICKSCPKNAININGVCRANNPESLCL